MARGLGIASVVLITPEAEHRLSVLRAAKVARRGQGIEPPRHTQAIQSETCTGVRRSTSHGPMPNRYIFGPYPPEISTSRLTHGSHDFKR